MSPLSNHFDVAVIGAGINGAGIARDAAMRGLRVVIIDKNDMCSGTSAVSSRLIHGGLRYLEYGEIPLVYESLHERRHLRTIAPHLVKPLRITIPIFASGRRGRWLVWLGMIAYDLLSFNKRLPWHKMRSKEALLAEEPGVNAHELKGAAQYSDAQVTFAERLVLENLIAAKANGAEVRTYHRVTSVRPKSDGGFELVIKGRDRVEVTILADAVVNAAGPWVDSVLATTEATLPRQIGGTKGSHIVVGRFEGAPKNAFYVEAAADGRPIFIIPWHEQYLIGTTDIRYDDDLNHIRANADEVQYLLAETNRVFPTARLQKSDIHYAYAGVRPLPHRKKGPESAITRKHVIKVNEAIGSGFLSIIGGKLTTYRNLAKQCVDKLGKPLGRRLPPCQTDTIALPGGGDLSKADQMLKEVSSIKYYARDRLLSVYGSRAEAIASRLTRESGEIEFVHFGLGVTAAEVRFVLDEEFVTTLADIVFRRMMIGFLPDQGRSMYKAIASVAASHLNWSDERRQGEWDDLIHYADSLRVQ